MKPCSGWSPWEPHPTLLFLLAIEQVKLGRKNSFLHRHFIDEHVTFFRVSYMREVCVYVYVCSFYTTGECLTLLTLLHVSRHLYRCLTMLTLLHVSRHLHRCLTILTLLHVSRHLHRCLNMLTLLYASRHYTGTRSGYYKDLYAPQERWDIVAKTHVLLVCLYL